MTLVAVAEVYSAQAAISLCQLHQRLVVTTFHAGAAAGGAHGSYSTAQHRLRMQH